MPVLSGRFVRLTWVSHIGQAPKTQRFEGVAYYQRDRPGYRATWFDSSGMARPIDAERRAEAIVATWGTLETELGETTYRPDGRDAVEVVDRVRGKNGEWREFGRTDTAPRAVMRRARPGTLPRMTDQPGEPPASPEPSSRRRSMRRPRCRQRSRRSLPRRCPICRRARSASPAAAATTSASGS